MFKEEEIKLGDLIRVRGHYDIELRDAQDGHVTAKVGGDNFITTAAKKSFLAWGLGELFNTVRNFNDVGMAVAGGLFQYLVMTDNVTAIPTTAVSMDNLVVGNRVGWCDTLSVYAGGDISTGTLNTNECSWDPVTGALKFVMDFGTDKVNDVAIGTVLLGVSNNPDYPDVSQVNNWPKECDIVDYRGGMDYYDDLIYIDDDIILFGDSHAWVYVKDRATGTDTLVTSAYDIRDTHGAGVKVGNNIYFIFEDDSSSYCYIGHYDIVNKTYTNDKQLSKDDYYGLYYEDGYFYYLYRYSTNAPYIVRITDDFVTATNGDTAVLTSIQTAVGGTFSTIVTDPDRAGNVISVGGTINVSFNIVDAFNGTSNYVELDYDHTMLMHTYHDGEWYGIGYARIASNRESTTDSGVAGNKEVLIIKNAKVVSMGSCLVLPTPITKSNTETMKVTYTLMVDTSI